jgi:hypothetical protein
MSLSGSPSIHSIANHAEAAGLAHGVDAHDVRVRQPAAARASREEARVLAATASDIRDGSSSLIGDGALERALAAAEHDAIRARPASSISPEKSASRSTAAPGCATAARRARRRGGPTSQPAWQQARHELGRPAAPWPARTARDPAARPPAAARATRPPPRSERDIVRVGTEIVGSRLERRAGAQSGVFFSVSSGSSVILTAPSASIARANGARRTPGSSW